MTESLKQLLQELFILAIGKIADTATMADLTALVGSNGDLSNINNLIDDYFGHKESQSSKVEVIQSIAELGLGLTIDATDAASALQTLEDLGLASWSSKFQFAATVWTGNAVILSNRAEAATYFTDLLQNAGKADFFSGASVNVAAANLMQGVDASSLSLAGAKAGLEKLATNLSQAGIKAAVVDGYIKGALVFADANGNGKLDPDEWNATTDDNGNYTLPSSAKVGTIIASGGTDILTNKPFQGVLTAPAGSTVVNPLTTIVQSLLASDSTISVAEATALAKSGLGLPADINPLSYDPLAVFSNSNADAAAKNKALAVQIKMLQVINIITQAANVLNTTINNTTVSTLQSSANIVSSALANALKNSTGTLDLRSSAVLNSVLQKATADTEAATGVNLPTSILNQLVTITSASNISAGSAASITDISKAAVISQGSVIGSLINGSAKGDLAETIAAFTGTNLSNAVNSAEPGLITATLPVLEPTPEPTPDPTGSFTVILTGSVVTFGGAATGDIDISIAAGTATFVRQSVTATSTIANISAKTIDLPAGTTLAVNAADVTALSGVTIKGAGTFKTTEGLTVAQLNSITFAAWTGTSAIHAVADTATNIIADTTWVTGSVNVSVIGDLTVANLVTIDAKT